MELQIKPKKICSDFNAASNMDCPLESLKKMWNSLKSNAKMYRSKQVINIKKTRGGPHDVKVDVILDKVSNIIGRGGVGLSDVVDSELVYLNEIIDKVDIQGGMRQTHEFGEVISLFITVLDG
ncbi:hypothetical protein FQA39_LY10870 [Lamprigera yunnana]|nr:hypothetical protein FQA39_LY10870 [Lamprigera yunnana]